MHNSIRSSVAAGMIVVLGISGGCNRGLQTSPQPVPSPQDESTAAPTGAMEPGTGWAAILGPATVPDGWQVFPCPNPVLLCLEANGDILGTVELISYPASDVTRKGMAPLVAGKEQAFLQQLVENHYTTIIQDRQGADPALTVTPETPTESRVGRFPGLRYGYTTSRGDGTLFERLVGYVTTDGTRVYVIVTGLINGDPSGSFSDVDSFAAFEPYLAPLVQGLRL